LDLPRDFKDLLAEFARFAVEAVLVTVRIIALDDLIDNKRAAGRPQDLVDCRLARARAHAAGDTVAARRASPA